MDAEFRRYFYGVLNGMPLDRAQEHGAVVAHMRVMRDVAMEHAGGGVEEVEKRAKKMRVQAGAGMLVFLNRRLLQ